MRCARTAARVLVLARHAPRPGHEDQAVQHRQPQRARQRHDARVGQETREEGAHRVRGRRLRRAGVYQQDADAFGTVVRRRRRASDAHAPRYR
jgi:hypothetical protein